MKTFCNIPRAKGSTLPQVSREAHVGLRIGYHGNASDAQGGSFSEQTA